MECCIQIDIQKYVENKAVQLIKTSKMFNHLDVVETLTCDIQHKENIPVETYQLSYTVRNKLVRKKK